MKILATAMLGFLLLGGGFAALAWILFMALVGAIDKVRNA